MKKVLICDDAAFMRVKLRKIIEVEGCEVLEAENGMVAVRMFQELRPDLVLLDITMPEVDGLRALKEIMATDPSAKVVMCSALAQETMVIQAIKEGARDYIVKPPQQEKVIAVVRKFLNA